MYSFMERYRNISNTPDFPFYLNLDKAVTVTAKYKCLTVFIDLSFKVFITVINIIDHNNVSLRLYRKICREI